jgi:hypothetical protein
MIRTGIIAGGVRLPETAPAARLKGMTETLGVVVVWTASAVQAKVRTAMIAAAIHRPTGASLLCCICACPFQRRVSMPKAASQKQKEIPSFLL